MVADYLSALERLMVVEPQPSWGPHLRSRSAIRKAPKKHFVDPSIAVAALAAGPQDLRADLNLFGFLFESLVVRDLRVYSQTFDGSVLHYRDNTLEADAIIRTSDQRWCAVEVKLGVSQPVVDGAAANLLRFAQRVDTSRSGEPAALVVITGTGYAYQRPDGVAVVPVGVLKP